MRANGRNIAQLIICLTAVAATIYSAVEQENKITAIRRELPRLQREIKKVQEENRRLQYEIDSFESPLHLMELLRKPEYGHLTYPYVDEVVVIQEASDD